MKNNFRSKKTKTNPNTTSTKSGSRPRQQSTVKKKKKVSSLDPNLLIQAASIAENKVEEITRKFEEFNLNNALATNLKNCGFVTSTPIQNRSFESIINKEDIIGIASTGTGKTGAFLIPLIQRLLNDQKFKTLIVVPTRELALQVADTFKMIAKDMPITSLCFIGGTDVEKDVRKLKNPVDFVIGTPGRLIDLKDRQALILKNFDVLILDEFDKMLDMGFVKDIKTLVTYMINRKQTLLFSATRDQKQQGIINDLMDDPTIIEVTSGNESSTNVHQDIIRIATGEDKFLKLVELVKTKEAPKTIVFTETKHLANRICQKLQKNGIKSDQIHSNKSQNYRVNALDKFKKSAVQVLVATDIAARGIDVDDVNLVVNYQMPNDYDTYIHRVGRTGRAGKTGHAFTFVDEQPIQ